ncbi:putative porin [Mucilaginibacter glaciei]|uniref:Porin n=1 Tax=Mucilaginibacter glaciei TaxID=2772109 RepID=A0A926S0M2_9SPHI|nr:putative porin [Mucilaginibacter glaciei]MBD1393115.1 putative porin [Mucilaginibacter glaciei]
MAQEGLAQVYPNQQQSQPVYTRDTVRNQSRKSSDNLDTLRKREENRKDSIEFNSKYIKITSERLLSDSTQLFPLDTGLVNFENYSVLSQPRNPKISLGYLGVAQRDLLFNPRKTIGFDEGQHSLDAYLLNPQDISYFNARVPYTLLSLSSTIGGLKESLFKVLHTQNVKPNWNVGFMMNFNGSRGFYASNNILAQNVSDVNVALFSWYHSVNKRYNLLTNVIFNNLKAPETGSILNDDVFTSAQGSLDKTTENVRLRSSFENWKNASIYLKQMYYIGRIDSNRKANGITSVLPTQRITYTFNYDSRKYHYLQNDVDTYNVFPDYYFSANRSRDSLNVLHLQNDFTYSFYLRGKSLKMVKNELKLDLGLTQDFYKYSQFVSDSVLNDVGRKEMRPVRVQNSTLQNITLKARLGYRFSDRINLDGDIRQIIQGRNFGDLLYDAKLTLAGGRKTGKIVLGAYLQSSSPGLVYTNWISNHYIFNNSGFSNQKITNLSFNYQNDALKLDLKAEYFLVTDYLYFKSQPGGIDATPTQYAPAINMLKVSVGKNLAFRKFNFDNYVVYQKTDNKDILRTPEVYTYSSLYYNTMLFVLKSQIGMSVRYNTAYVAPSYAVGLGQFYNGKDVTFTSYPIASVFFKGTLQRTNIFLQYDYANQGLFSKGFYTVNRYPQMDSAIKFGVAWTFYN